MKQFLILLGIIACIVGGALGGVFLLVSGWTILALPFWIAGAILAVERLARKMDV